jgi:uncharacterized protein YbjT (DUF2867 family)
MSHKAKCPHVRFRFADYTVHIRIDDSRIPQRVVLTCIRTHVKVSSHRHRRVHHEDRRHRRHRPDRLEDRAVLEFFETSGRNLLAAEAAAGVRHHVALSIVGTDRTPDNGYFRAKVAQENLIEASGLPYTIIRSTQFLEFLGGIADSSAEGNVVRLSPGLFQPIAADDVAAIVAEVALAAPRNGIVEIAGPERAPFNDIVARYLQAVGDPREVVRDPEARYYGGRVEARSLVPLGEARLGRIGFDEWLRRAQASA